MTWQNNIYTSLVEVKTPEEHQVAVWVRGGQISTKTASKAKDLRQKRLDRVKGKGWEEKREKAASVQTRLTALATVQKRLKQAGVNRRDEGESAYKRNPYNLAASKTKVSAKKGDPFKHLSPKLRAIAIASSALRKAGAQSLAATIDRSGGTKK